MWCWYFIYDNSKPNKSRLFAEKKLAKESTYTTYINSYWHFILSQRREALQLQKGLTHALILTVTITNIDLVNNIVINVETVQITTVYICRMEILRGRVFFLEVWEHHLFFSGFIKVSLHRHDDHTVAIHPVLRALSSGAFTTEVNWHYYEICVRVWINALVLKAMSR